MHPTAVTVPGLIELRNPFWALSGTDLRLLETLAFLARKAGKRLGRSLAMAYPSQAWLAAHVGACRSYVSERLQRLEAKGMIRIVRRRREEGVWKSNLYQIVSKKVWRLNALSACISKVSNHVGSSRHKPTFGGVTSGEKKTQTVFGKLFSGIGPVRMTDEQLEERRLRLRSQQEELKAKGLW
jgi:hypothetical protein